jgi:hypothetical protein
VGRSGRLPDSQQGDARWTFAEAARKSTEERVSNFVGTFPNDGMRHFDWTRGRLVEIVAEGGGRPMTAAETLPHWEHALTSREAIDRSDWRVWVRQDCPYCEGEGERSRGCRRCEFGGVLYLPPMGYLEGAATELERVNWRLDPRDLAILAERVALMEEARAADPLPMVGDFVRYADGTERRVSHVWGAYEEHPASVQTSDGGSFYLGNGYASMSGSLYSGAPADSFTLTEDKKDGAVWIFHHNMARAGGGRPALIPFRIYTAEEKTR